MYGLNLQHGREQTDYAVTMVTEKWQGWGTGDCVLHCNMYLMQVIIVESDLQKIN